MPLQWQLDRAARAEGMRQMAADMGRRSGAVRGQQAQQAQQQALPPLDPAVEQCLQVLARANRRLSLRDDPTPARRLCYALRQSANKRHVHEVRQEEQPCTGARIVSMQALQQLLNIVPCPRRPHGCQRTNCLIAAALLEDQRGFCSRRRLWCKHCRRVTREVPLTGTLQFAVPRARRAVALCCRTVHRRKMFANILQSVCPRSRQLFAKLSASNSLIGSNIWQTFHKQFAKVFALTAGQTVCQTVCQTDRNQLFDTSHVLFAKLFAKL